MSIKLALQILQNILITMLIQAALLWLTWNTLIPSLFIAGSFVTITYGQAFLMLILIKILKYDPLVLQSHQNLVTLTLIKQSEYARQQYIDQMNFKLYQEQQEQEKKRSD